MAKPEKIDIVKVLGTIEVCIDVPDRENFNDIELLVNRILSLPTAAVYVVRDRIKEIHTKHKDKFKKFSYTLITRGEDYGFDDFDAIIEVIVRGHRLETDKEYVLRLRRVKTRDDKNAREKKSQDNKDLREYERLKKKFG